MPISVKDCEYAENESAFTVKFDWIGVQKKNLSVAVASRYVKINCKPYFWEVFLLNEIDPDKCIVRIGEGQIWVILIKKSEGLWGHLSHPNAELKSYRNEKRLEAIDEIQRRVAEGHSIKRERKRERDDFLIREILKQEESEHKFVEFRKTVEKERINQELESICQNQKTNVGKMSSPQLKVKPVTENCDMPPPRKSGLIRVDFTPRHFSTAARESKLEDEQEWLKKVVASGVRAKTPVKQTDLSNAENNPEWLKEKGIKMFSIGDFHAAEKAFSMAIEIYPNNSSLYSNRSACYLKLKKYQEALNDSNKALELLTPALDENIETRMRCYVRRGTAYCGLNNREKGLQDYEEALRLCPDNKSLRCDVLNLSSKMNSKPKRVSSFRSLVTTV